MDKKIRFQNTLHHKSIETKYREERALFLGGLQDASRRDFMKLSGATLGAALASGVSLDAYARTFQPILFSMPQGKEAFRIAYISDSHLYTKEVNDRFVRSLLRAVDDVNRLDPQPDFVLYGGDLAQLGQKAELDLGAQILKALKAPVRMMVGEHDWYLDLGARWRELFGEDRYSFDHKGVHFVVLNSVVEKDFWTARGLSPMERMQTVAGLDNGVQSPFSVGEPQRDWLKKDLEKLAPNTPLVVFSHSPLYKLYRKWNFWTEDAEEVQAILGKFDQVTVIHGHTHQVLTNRIGNIHFHGLLSTAWPWPYAPEGLPELTVEMGRPNPFDPMDGCGDGLVKVYPDGLVDKVYNLWNRNPMTVSKAYTSSKGKEDRPPAPSLRKY